jgi:DUF971 family protein
MSHEGIRMVPEEQARREREQELPLAKIAVTPDKVRVLLTTGKGVEIDWADGHRSAWSFAWLRDACPCATCVEERKAQGRKAGDPKPKPTDLLPMYVPAAKPLSVQPVGRYAIQFNWADGHSGGIYSWEYLRRSCLCQECGFAAEDAGRTVN